MGYYLQGRRRELRVEAICSLIDWIAGENGLRADLSGELVIFNENSILGGLYGQDEECIWMDEGTLDEGKPSVVHGLVDLNV